MGSHRALRSAAAQHWQCPLLELVVAVWMDFGVPTIIPVVVVKIDLIRYNVDHV